MNTPFHMDMSLTIESSTANLRKVEDFLEEISYEAGISREAFGRVLVSVMEAVNNSIIHGNGGDPEKKVNIRFIRGTDSLSVTITDEGGGFAPEDVPDPTSPENIENLRGRGVFLMRRLADAVEYSPSGNSVKMSFNRISD
jgi:serine/threonine-protein kinase RsbW